MKLISYKIKSDKGFAPNPYFGCLTLATCKPAIRRSENTNVGDWIVGWTCASSKLYSTPVGREKLVFLAKISKIISIAQYWEEYPQKRPDQNKGLNFPEFYGDNIYKPNSECSFGFEKVDSKFHCKESNKKTDVGGRNVIICNEFYYFSAANALEVPINIKKDFNQVLRGHKIFENISEIEDFIKYVKSNKGKCKLFNEVN